MIVAVKLCPTSSAESECTKEVEEDGVCCCSERLSAENDFPVWCLLWSLSALELCMRCRVSKRRQQVDQFYALTTDRLQKKSVITDAFSFSPPLEIG